MAVKEGRIEDYQTLELSLTLDVSLDVRSEIENMVAHSPWHRNKIVEKRLESHSSPEENGVIAFERDASQENPAIQLALWPNRQKEKELSGTSHRYRLGNIVSLDGKALRAHQFNDAIAEFVAAIDSTANKNCAIEIELSPRLLTITDLTSSEAANALRAFSEEANRSTGASHPADEARWWEFNIKAHRAQGKLTASLLEQWLNEVDRWDEDTARELAYDWQKIQEVLRAYDAAA